MNAFKKGDMLLQGLTDVSVKHRAGFRTGTRGWGGGTKINRPHLNAEAQPLKILKALKGCEGSSDSRRLQGA